MNTISVRIDDEKTKLLDMLCEAMNRSRNYLVNQAIDNYLQNEAHHLQELMQSIEEADAGKLIDHADAMQQVDQLIEKHS